MNITTLIIYAIAIWRVSNLFVYEAGPFDIFVKIRSLTGIQHDEDKYPFIVPDRLFSGILSCVWCFSIWISLFWTIFWIISPLWSLRIAVIFAFSGGAILVDLIVRKVKA